MSQSTGFFSKIRENYNSKFSNLSLTASHPEKDGNTEDDTLIHNAFVRYFDKVGQEYPEWLGVEPDPTSQPTRPQTNGRRYLETTNEFQDSSFQPIRHNNEFNNSYAQQQSRHSYPDQRAPEQENDVPPRNSSRYQPRTSSRLDHLHSKSRQQAIPGAGYNTSRPAPGRSNSYSTTGSRLRERLLHGDPRATWGGDKH